jgi:hypothetical protein
VISLGLRLVAPLAKHLKITVVLSPAVFPGDDVVSGPFVAGLEQPSAARTPPAAVQEQLGALTVGQYAALGVREGVH